MSCTLICTSGGLIIETITPPPEDFFFFLLLPNYQAAVDHENVTPSIAQTYQFWSKIRYDEPLWEITSVAHHCQTKERLRQHCHYNSWSDVYVLQTFYHILILLLIISITNYLCILCPSLFWLLIHAALLPYFTVSKKFHLSLQYIPLLYRLLSQLWINQWHHSSTCQLWLLTDYPLLVLEGP